MYNATINEPYKKDAIMCLYMLSYKFDVLESSH
jgi:hypothetical protein